MLADRNLGQAAVEDRALLSSGIRFVTIKKLPLLIWLALATAYVFLHELQHITFLSYGGFPVDPGEEELACDVWARSFLTDKVGIYAESSGENFTRVFDK